MKYTDNIENVLQLIVQEMKINNDIKKDMSTSLNNMDITLEEMTDVLKDIQVTIIEHNQELNDIKNTFVPVIEEDPEREIILEDSEEKIIEENNNESTIHTTCFSEDERIKEDSKKGIFCFECKTHNIFFNKEKKKLICNNCKGVIKSKNESINQVDKDENELLKGIMEFQKK